jgi:hypothetical protein
MLSMPDYVTETGHGVTCAHWNDSPSDKSYIAASCIRLIISPNFHYNISGECLLPCANVKLEDYVLSTDLEMILPRNETDAHAE